MLFSIWSKYSTSYLYAEFIIKVLYIQEIVNKYFCKKERKERAKLKSWHEFGGKGS